MGNLIIKGKGGAGNKLILQDQAGGAVLTTADSGATIANASLTTPTIASMANCTFPAGHCVQFITYSYNSASSDTINSGTGERANISDDESMFQKQITITSGNKVFVNMMAGVSGSSHSDDEWGAWLGIYAKEGGSYRNVYGNSWGQYINYSHSSSYNWDVHIHNNISYLDTPTVTNPIYGAQIWRYKSNIRLRCSATEYPFVINLMEIQQ